MLKTHEFLNLSASWWEAIGTWVAAVGTVGAIWTALSIARRDNSVRLKVNATIGQIFGNPMIPVQQRHLWITVTNLGRRSVLLQNISWRSGLLHPRWRLLSRIYAVQNAMVPNGPNLPLKMEDGDIANWMVPLDEWLDHDISNLIAKPHWLGVRTLRVVAHVSTGDSVSSAVSRSLADSIYSQLNV